MGRSADSGRKSAWEHRSGLAGGWLAGEATPAVAGAVGAVVATAATVAWSAIAFALPGFLLVVPRATNAPLCAVGSPDRCTRQSAGQPERTEGCCHVGVVELAETGTLRRRARRVEGWDSRRRVRHYHGFGICGQLHTPRRNDPPQWGPRR
ncbi:hypothetical protein PI125_g12237 [Phytophthora idaei]|nr:hypothetical protein PI125_g12237 [Phytophthora idaei]